MMPNISPNTYNEMKRFISVRLQQGVPLLDADWNEMEDIRRFELQAFLKWFVGDGVPAGNDGFRIQPLTNIVFSVTAPGVTFKVKASDAAAELGLATETATSHLAGTTHEPFDLRDTKLAIEFTLKAARLSATVQAFEITFDSASFHDIAAATASEVADAINQAISTELTKLNSAVSFASVANGNDFVIGGGDGTPAGAGRCLVEGWDVLNKDDQRYQAQKLYNNSTLATAWNVDVLPPLTPPDGERTDLIYLDVWERVVDAEEDPDLVNPAIGIETCVRLKREWVVRVLEDCPQRKVPVYWPPQQKERGIRKSGHVYYALAQLQRKAQQTLIEPSMITDLRRTGLSLAHLKDEIADARGTKATLGNRLDESLTESGELRWNVVGNEQLKLDRDKLEEYCVPLPFGDFQPNIGASSANGYSKIPGPFETAVVEVLEVGYDFFFDTEFFTKYDFDESVLGRHIIKQWLVAKYKIGSVYRFGSTCLHLPNYALFKSLEVNLDGPATKFNLEVAIRRVQGGDREDMIRAVIAGKESGPVKYSFTDVRDGANNMFHSASMPTDFLEHQIEMDSSTEKGKELLLMGFKVHYTRTRLF
ncbi:MAG: hypothetical protein R3E79_10890 [Caldilineaceae bacterium]